MEIKWYNRRLIELLDGSTDTKKDIVWRHQLEQCKKFADPIFVMKEKIHELRRKYAYSRTQEAIVWHIFHLYTPDELTGLKNEIYRTELIESIYEDVLKSNTHPLGEDGPDMLMGHITNVGNDWMFENNMNRIISEYEGEMFNVLHEYFRASNEEYRMICSRGFPDSSYQKKDWSGNKGSQFLFAETFFNADKRIWKQYFNGEMPTRNNVGKSADGKRLNEKMKAVKRNFADLRNKLTQIESR